MARRRKADENSFVMISVVSERFGIHPQTLRLYEREGLIKPVRSAGNTRLYDEVAIRRLKMILALTRDMGVNLAGVEVILNLQERLDEVQGELDKVMEFVRQEISDRRAGVDRQHALVKVERGALVKR